MSMVTLDQKLEKTLEKLAERMRDRLRLGGRSALDTIRSSRSVMPRKHRRGVDEIVQALEMAPNPKLARQIDAKRLESHARDMMEHLKTVNVRSDRERRVLDIVFTVLMNLLVLGLLVLALVAWQGLL